MHVAKRGKSMVESGRVFLHVLDISYLGSKFLAYYIRIFVVFNHVI